MKDNNPPQPQPIEVNGRSYPIWSQFIHRKDEWIGGNIHSFESGYLFKGTIKDIELRPNGSNSAFLCFTTNDGGEVGGDVGCLGIMANPDNDGALMFGGFGNHKWKIWTRAESNTINQLPIENVMVKAGGKPFKCDCGGNVFHHPINRKDVFVCNACGKMFTGE